MSSLKDNKTCALLEQYLSYLIIIKGRSPLTIEEYRVDCAMLFEFIKRKRGVSDELLDKRDFSDVDIDFIKSVTITDLYEFITYCGEIRKVTTATRARKIVSIRQFWKYLKNKAHLLENNITEELEMPNSALRLSELVSINLEQIETDNLEIIGKGNKERRIFLTPSTKRAINAWLEVRKNMNTETNALFITKHGTRVKSRGVQDIVKKYLKKSNLNNMGISTHKLRHTSKPCFINTDT